MDWLSAPLRAGLVRRSRIPTIGSAHHPPCTGYFGYPFQNRAVSKSIALCLMYHWSETGFASLICDAFFPMDIRNSQYRVWSGCSNYLPYSIGVPLIPPLPTNSAIMGHQFVLFSHHPRTDRPSSQHRFSGYTITTKSRTH